MEKACKKCGISKPLGDFHKDKSKPDGHAPRCKVCKSIYNICVGRVKRNINNQKHKDNKTDQYFKTLTKNRERLKLYSKTDRFKLSRKRKYQRHKSEGRLSVLADNLRSTIRFRLKKGNTRRNRPYEEILGADFETVKKHIERQFKKGMTWANNNFRGWHIDHKIPLASAKTEEELIKLFHYTNLQPLWAVDNVAKRDKILPIQTTMTI